MGSYEGLTVCVPYKTLSVFPMGLVHLSETFTIRNVDLFYSIPYSQFWLDICFYIDCYIIVFFLYFIPSNNQ